MSTRASVVHFSLRRNHCTREDDVKFYQPFSHTWHLMSNVSVQMKQDLVSMPSWLALTSRQLLGATMMRAAAVTGMKALMSRCCSRERDTLWQREQVHLPTENICRAAVQRNAMRWKAFMTNTISRKEPYNYGAFSRVPSPALKVIDYIHRTRLRTKHKIDANAV